MIPIDKQSCVTSIIFLIFANMCQCLLVVVLTNIFEIQKMLRNVAQNSFLIRHVTHSYNGIPKFEQQQHVVQEITQISSAQLIPRITYVVDRTFATRSFVRNVLLSMCMYLLYTLCVRTYIHLLRLYIVHTQVLLSVTYFYSHVLYLRRTYI